MGDLFRGWYFRCQSPEHTLALIPAVHRSGGEQSGSLQVITDTGCWNVELRPEEIQVHKRGARAALEHARFSEHGIQLDVSTPGCSLWGSLRFTDLSPIRYDIMGPFRWVPLMECRHSVVSMRHSVHGSLWINGGEYSFQNGDGYLEGDRGRSFPRQYAWTQCFFPGGSLMLSVGEIPLGPFSFTGIIGIIQTGGKEYRLATYLGAKAVQIQRGALIIRQGDLLFTAALLEQSPFELRAPAAGAMTRTIRENAACRAAYQLQEKSRTILEFSADNAAFEYEYPE